MNKGLNRFVLVILFIAMAMAACAPPATEEEDVVTVVVEETDKVQRPIYFTDSSPDSLPGKIYRLDGNTVSVYYTRQKGFVHSVAISPDGVFHFCDANAIPGRIYQLHNGQEQEVYAHDTYVRDLAFDEKGELYFSEATGAGGDGYIYRLEGNQASLYYTVDLDQVGGFWAGNFAFDPEGRLWLSNGNRIPASLYRVVNGIPELVFTSPNESIVGFYFTSTGSLIYGNHHQTLYRLTKPFVQPEEYSSYDQVAWLNDVSLSRADWTFMVYVDGDNNLEGAAIGDFAEMAGVGSSDSVLIAVQMDLLHVWPDSRRFLVEQGDKYTDSPLENLGEVNMGAQEVLRDFVEWGVGEFPADNYLLAIWNHGGGWRDNNESLYDRAISRADEEQPDAVVARAVSWDDTDNDVLFMHEVQQALAQAQKNTGVKLDVVGFDACLMGMIEVAYEIRDNTDYMVGSEQTEPGDGWPYDDILGNLVKAPDTLPEALAADIVTQYVASYAGESGITQSAVDVSQITQLASEIDDFTEEANDEWNQLADARSNALEYHPYYARSYWGVDAWDFADEVATRVASSPIQNAATELKDAIELAVIEEGHSSDMDDSHGLAIYFPPGPTEFANDPDHTGYEDSNTYMPVDFVEHTQWDNWLQDYYANNP